MLAQRAALVVGPEDAALLQQRVGDEDAGLLIGDDLGTAPSRSVTAARAARTVKVSGRPTTSRS
jgi:hypothetical protein